MENLTGSPPGMELGQELKLANYSNTAEMEVVRNEYLPNETLIEGMCLTTVGVLGVFLNIAVLVIVGINNQLHKWMTGFTIHGCLLDMFKVKSVDCICRKTAARLAMFCL